MQQACGGSAISEATLFHIWLSGLLEETVIDSESEIKYFDEIDW